MVLQICIKTSPFVVQRFPSLPSIVPLLNLIEFNSVIHLPLLYQIVIVLIYNMQKGKPEISNGKANTSGFRKQEADIVTMEAMTTNRC